MHLPVWQWHTQQWAVRRWTASWRSGRSVSAQGRVSHNQEESPSSRTEDNKQNIWSECLPKWRYMLLTKTFPYKWEFILNGVLCRFWIWSIKKSGYVHFWTETLQLSTREIGTVNTREWSSWLLRLQETFPPCLIHVGLFAVHQLVWFVLMNPDSSMACS